MWLNAISEFAVAAVIWTVLPCKASAGYSYAVYVLKQNTTQGKWASVLECQATGANFGDQLEMNIEINACGRATDPIGACSPVIPVNTGPINNETLLTEEETLLSTQSRYDYCLGYFGLIERGNCSFAKKAFLAQRAGYAAAIIVNDPGAALVPMDGDDEYGGSVSISVFMVSNQCGITILSKYPYEQGYVVMVRSFYNYDLIKYLIPFVVVVGFCFVIMLAAMVIKFVRDRRRLARRRLSRRNLRKLPTKKYKKVSGQEPETCPICLDDFDDGDKLRVLPCKHMYHTKCVDPWLTKNRKVCPVCKRKVLPGSGDSSDSDEENQANSAAGHAPGLTQGTPLLGSAPPSENNEGPFTVGNSMFYAQYAQSRGGGGLSDEHREYVTPPDSPEPGEDTPGPSSSESSSRRSSRRKPKPRVVVPGFTGGSQERLIVPVPTEDGGMENPGYSSDEDSARAIARPQDMLDVSAYKQPKPRRKRHPAANNTKTGDEAALLSEQRLTLDSESGLEEESAGAKLAKSEKTEPVLHLPKQKKKKRTSAPRQKAVDRRPIPASAPASLREEASSVLSGAGREREESLRLEEEEEEEEERDTGREGRKEEGSGQGNNHESYSNEAYVV